MSDIKFFNDDNEVIRIDAKGFHYRGQFIADAGESHRLLVEFLRKHQPEGSWQHAHAEPEPEWPTDEEIMELMPQQMRDDLAAAARAMSGFDLDNIKAASVFRIILNRHSVDHARAVLARWGRPATVPVPVSERLPGAEDCDAEGRCWWLIAGCEAWALGKQSSDLTHWLPANALPLPSGEVE